MKLCYNVLVCLIVLHYFCCSNNCFILSGNSGWWKQNLHVPWLEIIPTINAHCAICFPYFPKNLFSICIPPPFFCCRYPSTLFMIANKKLLNGRFLPVNGQFYNFVISYVAFSVIFCITFYSKNHGTKYYKQGKIDFFHITCQRIPL